MKQSEILARMRQAFSEKYNPKGLHDYVEFEIALDHLIYKAFEVAQEPFVQQFNFLKEHTLQKLTLEDISRLYRHLGPTGSGVKDEKTS